MITIIKTVFSVLQVILMLTMWFSTKNRNDRGVVAMVIGYLFLLTVVLWL